MKTIDYPEIKKILANLETLLAATPAPIQEADTDPKVMQQLLNDHSYMIKACYATINSMADTLYSHIDGSKHLPAIKNWDHMDYACKQLGFGKEEAVRRAAYASKKTKVIIG